MSAAAVAPETLERFLERWDYYLAAEAAPTLRCTEVEALADLFRGAGRFDEADMWISQHSPTDDIGDLHALRFDRDDVEAPGFRCERCGGFAPHGLGVEDWHLGAAEESEELTRCACGRYQLPAPLPTTTDTSTEETDR